MAHPTGKYGLGAVYSAMIALLLVCAMTAAAEDGVPPGPGVSAPQASENAQMRAELEQLKQLVLQQQSRINALERQQTPGAAAVGSDNLIDMLSSAGLAQAAVATPAPQQAAPQVATVQAPQNSGSSDERVRNLERRIKGLGPLSISGDLRLRGDPYFNGPRDGSQDRARASIRARLNFLADLGQQFQAGISVASGDVNNPISTSQTLGVFYTRKAFALDQAFISYKPAEFKPLTLIGGKFRPVWFSTELTWDKDLNPEGAGETLAFPLENIPVLKRVAVVGVQLPFAEVAYNTTTTRNIVQSMMYGTQLQTNWQLMSRLRLSAYAGYYDFQNADAIALAIAKASSRNPQTPWSGSLPLNPGNTDQNSITTTASANVVMVNGKPVPTGVTNITNAQFGSTVRTARHHRPARLGYRQCKISGVVHRRLRTEHARMRQRWKHPAQAV